MVATAIYSVTTLWKEAAFSLCRAAAYKKAQIPRQPNARNPASTHIFYQCAIETAGTWHEMAIEQEIGRRITTITEVTRETTFLPMLRAFRPSVCLSVCPAP